MKWKEYVSTIPQAMQASRGALVLGAERVVIDVKEKGQLPQCVPTPATPGRNRRTRRTESQKNIYIKYSREKRICQEGGHWRYKENGTDVCKRKRGVHGLHDVSGGRGPGGASHRGIYGEEIFPFIYSKCKRRGRKRGYRMGLNVNEIPLLGAEDIECRIQSIKKKDDGRVGAILLLYKNARVDMRMLDQVFGAGNWQRTHEESLGTQAGCGN